MQVTVPHTNGAGAFIAAVRNDDRVTVEAYINSSGYMNYRELDGKDGESYDKGYTALLIASRHNKIDMAQLLIDRGAIVDLKCSTGLTALHVAIKEGHLDMVRLLVEKGAELTQLKNKKSPLHMAVDAEHMDIIKLLLEHDQIVDIGGPDDITPLYSASENGRVSVAQLLLEKGANIDAQHKNKTTPLFIASKLDFPRPRTYLIAHSLINRSKWTCCDGSAIG